MPEMDDRHGPHGRLTRRAFLAGTIATTLAACSGDDTAEPEPSQPPATEPPSSTPATTSPPTTTDSSSTTEPTTPTTEPTTTEPTGPPPFSDPFTLGVASGDPLPDRVILWTRLLPVDGTPDGDVDVEWEVATDSSMAELVSSGTGVAVAALGHSVHVDADGLEPDREYWYRFRVAGHESEPARTRTFAPPGTTPERFRFAFSSCQNWEQGYYTAYRDVVEQGDLDAFVFLGDYIYEYASGGYSDDRGRLTGQDFECETLEQYRARYALYRSDPLLQSAHSLVPWIVTWDDHEVDNDYAGDSSEEDAPTGAFDDRRAAGYQAWYEHMPVRLPPPSGPDWDIYRSFAHGDLLRFHVLDTRQHRSDQQRGEPFVDALGPSVQVRDETLAQSPDHQMLGDAQRAWLIEGVDASAAIWDVLAQQVFMFGASAIPDAEPPIIVVDTWDGYALDRTRLLEALGTSTDNLVVLSGDFHSAAVGDLRVDPFDRSLPVIGTELMASPISSAFFDADFAIGTLVETALAANPQIKWFEARRGYTVCEVTPDRWRATYRAVADPFDEASAVETISEWEIAAGAPGAARI
jgi:alkaline phosphatase D